MMLVIAGLAIVLRALMLLSGKSLWSDEWFSVELAQKSFHDVFWGSMQDVHPPAYFLALHGAIRLFGEAEWAYRLISFLAGIAVVGVIYFLTKSVFGKKAALYAFFLSAISPYWLQSANEIRSYALLALLSSLTLLFFVQALRDATRRVWLLGYTVSATLAVYVEHYAWFVVLATGVTLFFEKVGGRTRKELWRAFICACLLGGASLALASYQAIFREHMFEGYRIREYWSVAILFKKMVGLLWHFTNGYYFSMIPVDRISYYLKHSPVFWLSAVSMLAAVMLLLFSFKEVFLKDRTWFVLAGMVLCFPIIFLISFYSIRLEARYLSFAAPVFFVMIGGALAFYPRERFRNAAFLLLTTIAVIGSAHTVLLKTDAAHKEDYKGLVSYVFARTGSGDVVCGLGSQVRYYRQQLTPDSQTTVLPEMVNLNEENTRDAKHVWVVDQLNMHTAVWMASYDRIKTRLAELGFQPSAPPHRIGGEEGLVVAYPFEKKSLA